MNKLVKYFPKQTHLPHGGNELDVLEQLPVEVLAPVVHASLLQQQLEQGDGLLGAVGVHLGHVHVVNEHQQPPSCRGGGGDKGSNYILYFGMWMGTCI